MSNYDTRTPAPGQENARASSSTTVVTRNDNDMGKWLLGLLAVAAIVVAAFFALGGDADVDTQGGDVDIEVPQADVDVDAPDIDADVDVDIDEADAEANAGE